MLRNFHALKMAVSLESVMHNNGQRDMQPLMLAFTRLLDQQPLFSRTLGLV